MIKFLWILVVIVIIYLIYEFRYYLKYFYNLIDVTHKNQKGIKDIQKKGMDKRNLSNEQIENYVQMSKRYLISSNLLPLNKEYILNDELERHLRYSRFSEKYVLELLNDILDYLNLNKTDVDLKVNYISSKYYVPYVGSYLEKEKSEIGKHEIIINIKNDMIMATIVSILAHECTHYLLLSNGIKLKSVEENECLTDVSALIVGFGKFIEEGYKISNKVIYDEINHRSINKERVGYLSYKDVKYAIKYIKKTARLT